MRTVDLAIYADALAAEAATLAARLERARARLRQVALEREARQALPPQVVAHLERLGVLGSGVADGALADLHELTAAVDAVSQLQAWVEERLAASTGRAGYAAAAGAVSPASSAAR